MDSIGHLILCIYIILERCITSYLVIVLCFMWSIFYLHHEHSQFMGLSSLQFQHVVHIFYRIFLCNPYLLVKKWHHRQHVKQYNFAFEYWLYLHFGILWCYPIVYKLCTMNEQVMWSSIVCTSERVLTFLK